MIWDASNDGQGPLQYNPGNQFGTVQQTDLGWQYVGFNTGLFNDGESWRVDWDCLVNPDPFVNATLTITNNSTSTQTFDTYMVLVLGGPVVPAYVNGSVALTINNFQPGTSSAVVGSAGESIYQAFLDPIPQNFPGPSAASANYTLWDDPTTHTVAVGNGSGSFGPVGFSNVLSPGAVNAIAIRLRITLSGRDTAIISGVFEITEVPGPATALVFGAFAALSGGRRRRR